MSRSTPSLGSLWDQQDETEEDETDATTRRPSADLPDLDVAILSAIDQLGADVTQVATLLDETPKDSLWRRTLNREHSLWQILERDVLISRATWLWNLNLRTAAAMLTATHS